MARATTKLLERLAQQQQRRLQQQQSQPASKPGTSTVPVVTTERLAPAPGQGRGRLSSEEVRPAQWTIMSIGLAWLGSRVLISEFGELNLYQVSRALQNKTANLGFRARRRNAGTE